MLGMYAVQLQLLAALLGQVEGIFFALPPVCAVGSPARQQ